MKESKHPVFLKSLYGLGTIFFISILIFLRADKDKYSFSKATGELIYFEKSYENYPIRDPGKYRFLRVTGYPKIFEIFVGNESGDFKPKFEKVDNLAKGQVITIYYDENSTSVNDPINRLAYFIDRRNEPIFIKGFWEKNLAYFLSGVAIMILAVLIILKRKGIIE